MLREKWADEGGPEEYGRRLPFIHARSFVTTLALLERTLLVLQRYDFGRDVNDAISRALDDFIFAVPGLKAVRDSVAHAEDRIRGKVREREIAPTPIVNNAIHAPGGGALVLDMLNGRHFGCTTADGSYVEIDVSDATTLAAQVAVQAIFDVLPWRDGPRLREPSR